MEFGQEGAGLRDIVFEGFQMRLKWIVCEDNLNLLGYYRIYESVSFPQLLFNCSNHFPIPRASHKLFSPQGPEWSGFSVAQAGPSLEMALQLKHLKDILGSCRMWSGRAAGDNKQPA